MEGHLNFFLIVIYLASHKYMFFQPLRHMKYFIKLILSTNGHDNDGDNVINY